MRYKNIVVDVELDGPLLGTNSMICFGAVILDDRLKTTFYGQVKPISNVYDPQALAISGFTRKEHMKFGEPVDVMYSFLDWIREYATANPILWSDNNGYDASWINWYFLKYVGVNPFGWSSRRIGDVLCGMNLDAYYRWKKHRDSERFPHNHDPVSDASGNAAALLYAINQGFKLKL